MAQELMAKKRAALNRLKTARGHFTNHRLEVQRGCDRPRRVLQRHHTRRGREGWHGMSRQHCCGPCRLAKRKTRPCKRPETGAKSVGLRLHGFESSTCQQVRRLSGMAEGRVEAAYPA
jgi:hypothetical protein